MLVPLIARIRGPWAHRKADEGLSGIWGEGRLEERVQRELTLKEEETFKEPLERDGAVI